MIGVLEILTGTLVVLITLAVIDASRSITIQKFARRMDAALIKEARACRR